MNKYAIFALVSALILIAIWADVIKIEKKDDQAYIQALPEGGLKDSKGSPLKQQ